MWVMATYMNWKIIKTRVFFPIRNELGWLRTLIMRTGFGDSIIGQPFSTTEWTKCNFWHLNSLHGTRKHRELREIYINLRVCVLGGGGDKTSKTY